jgi:hypothetical protein
MGRTSRWLARAACAAALALTASAQGLLHYLQHPSPNSDFEPSVARIGDLDGDGVTDFAVVRRIHTTQSQEVQVRSGVDASPLLVIPPFQPNWFSSNRPLYLAGVGDVDGDGTPDLAIGDVGAQYEGTTWGAVSLHSGSDGEVIHVWWGAQGNDGFGTALAGAGDVDADGTPDVIVGARQQGPSGSAPGYAKVYSGSTGLCLRSWTGDSPGGGFGHCVDTAGDVDGDGHSDLVVGSATRDEVRVLSGRDGSLLRLLEAGAPSWSVVGGRDLDGDGVPDVVVGSPTWALPGTVATGRVTAWSGADWSLVRDVEGTVSDRFLGCSVDVIDDVDDDGLPEILAGVRELSPGARTGGVLLLGSAQPDPLLGVAGDAPLDFLGCHQERLCALGDLDGDGYAEFAAAAEDYVRVHSTTLLPPAVYCTPKVNSVGCTPSVSWSGTSTLSGPDDFVLRCDGVLSRVVGIAFWSRSPRAALLLGGTMCVGPPRELLGAVHSGGSSSGQDCMGTLQFPFSQALMASAGLQPGDTACVQFFYRDPLHPDGTGAGLSGGVRFSVFP